MADSGPSISKIVASSTSFVEKAVEFRHFMLFTAFVLLLDSCLVIFYGKDLLSSFESLNEPEVNAANAIVFLALFFFSMALFFPALRQIIRLGIAWVYFKWFWSLESKNEYGDGWHYPSLKKDEALKNRDNFVLDIIAKHEEEIMNKHINLNVGFALVLLFAVNFLAIGSESLNTLTQQAAFLLDKDFGFWINRLINAGIGVFIIFSLIMLGLSLNPVEEDKVYIPSGNVKSDV
ncbi:hypothetical protein [Halomonas halocynthiae]|uniref:hypothetical protein n=1 Tax=Halomonas halocynthiae TaxID=176290 RepID=UPI0012EB1210|nr:hypothetical protein [Halomonas halocynthiae]